MPLNISYKVSGEKLLKLILFEHVFIWLVTTSVLWSVDSTFKKIIMMLIEGLKPSLDEQDQILLVRKKERCLAKQQKKQLHNSFYPLNKPRILYW